MAERQAPESPRRALNDRGRKVADKLHDARNLSAQIDSVRTQRALNALIDAVWTMALDPQGTLFEPDDPFEPPHDPPAP